MVEPYLVRFEYVLHDLSEISDDELREGAVRTALAKLVAMCFKHDLEIQNGDDHLIGTATAQGDGARLGCRWDMDAVASRTSR